MVDEAGQGAAQLLLAHSSWRPWLFPSAASKPAKLPRRGGKRQILCCMLDAQELFPKNVCEYVFYRKKSWWSSYVAMCVVHVSLAEGMHVKVKAREDVT